MKEFNFKAIKNLAKVIGDGISKISPEDLHSVDIASLLNSSRLLNEKLIVLNYLYKRLSPQTGLISALFLILYSIFRFVIEFSREPDPQLGLVIMSFTMGQLISVFTLLAGIYLYYLSYGKSNYFR